MAEIPRPLVHHLEHLDRRPGAARADDHGWERKRRLAAGRRHERPVDGELDVMVVNPETCRLR